MFQIEILPLTRNYMLYHLAVLCITSCILLRRFIKSDLSRSYTGLEQTKQTFPTNVGVESNGIVSEII
jgi:hypothetical protein